MRLASLHRSLTFRLALLYLLVLTASVGLLLGLAWWGGVQRPMERMEREVAREAALAREAYRTGGLAGLEQAMAKRSPLPSRPYFALLGAGGRPISGYLVEEVRPLSDGWAMVEFAEAGGTRDEDALTQIIGLDQGFTLLVGRETEPFEEREDLILEALGWSALIAPILGLVVGLLTSLAVSHRIEAVARTARGVMRGRLSERVEVRGTGDDFDQLAETLNMMLERIESLVQSVSRVSDHVAHELRTPLTRLRAELEVLAREGETHGLPRMRVERALAEANRLQSIFDALLRIARIEAGQHDAALRELDLVRLLHDAVELYQPEAEAKGVRIRVEAPPRLEARGDLNLLFQAFCNLLDNAVKFAPAGGEVRVEAVDDGQSIAVAVSDNGPGVATEHRSRIVERFYRAPNGSATPGVGLGLPLVTAVCASHGGELALEDAGPGLRATMSLPKPAPRSAARAAQARTA